MNPVKFKHVKAWLMSSSDTAKDKTGDLSRDLFYEITSKLDILVGHSGQILAQAIGTIIKMLNLKVIACQLGSSFSFVFLKKQTIHYSHVT